MPSDVMPPPPGQWTLGFAIFIAVGPAVGFAGVLIMYLIPEVSAVIAPEYASSVVLLASGIAQMAMVLTPVVGDMADKSQDFLGLIRNCNWLSAATLLAMMGLVTLPDPATLPIPTMVAASNSSFTLFYDGVVLSTGLFKIVIFYVLIFAQGFAFNAAMNLGLSLTGVWGTIYPNLSTRFAAVGSLNAVLGNLVSATIFGMVPITAGQPLLFVASLVWFALSDIILKCCIPKRIMRPFDSLPVELRPPVATSTKKRSFWGSLADLGGQVKASIRELRGESYFALRWLTYGFSLSWAAIMTDSAYILYFMEDQTSVGADAATWAASISVACMALVVFTIVPIGGYLDKVQRPITALFWTNAFMGCAMLTTILGYFNPLWVAFALLVVTLVSAILFMFLIPAFMKTTLYPEKLTRDMLYGFACPPFAAFFISLALNHVLASFGTEEVEGRARPRYALQGYIVVFSLVFLVSSLGLVCLCVSQASTRRRLEEELRNGRKLPVFLAFLKRQLEAVQLMRPNMPDQEMEILL
eukprot:CAMPEP_0174703752 /NCGR_PEP_ID=MMETSP1094-20130205/7584_1 /TAXON_ID=156173 /ORGANISM="Chrysochromulina brevifilum, Strain UTEX LB 985" /LENGTH=526 /DNA_ID=CAMNT_0015901711 /DNA_START=38 /DNA_END=1618 /DNA_ORIENTATION=-